MGKIIEGVIIKELKCIVDRKGKVMQVMKSTDKGFKKFGEVYCSVIYPGVVKGWHFNKHITKNYVVLQGMIKLVLFDDRAGSSSRGLIQEIVMGDRNYIRVTIPSGIWSGFKCLGNSLALLCNVIDRPHDPDDARKCDPDNADIPYDWEKENGSQV